MMNFSYDKSKAKASDLVNVMLDYGTPPNVIRHALKVAEIAEKIARRMNSKGYNFDIGVIRRAGILHDIARAEGRGHAEIGAEIIGRCDAEAAEIVAAHMVHEFPRSPADITESDIVALGDRLTRQDEFVGLKERGDEIKGRIVGDEERRKRIEANFAEASDFFAMVENIIGSVDGAEAE